MFRGDRVCLVCSGKSSEKSVLACLTALSASTNRTAEPTIVLETFRKIRHFGAYNAGLRSTPVKLIFWSSHFFDPQEQRLIDLTIGFFTHIFNSIFNFKMYFQTLFVYIIATVTLAASSDPEHLFKRDDLKKCTSSINKWNDQSNSQPPKAPTALSSISQDRQPTVTHPCVYPTITGSLADTYSSYVTKYVGWYDNQLDIYQDMTKACKGVKEASSALKNAKPPATTCDKFHWASESGKVIKGKKPNSSYKMGVATSTLVIFCVLANLFMV